MPDNINPSPLLLLSAISVSAKTGAELARFLATAEAAVQAATATNKAAIFPALAAAGIARVTIDYDGGGDEGNLEPPQAVDAEGNSVEFPDTRVTIVTLGFDNTTLHPETHLLSDAVESAACSLLEQTHGGWENNEGAAGQFVLDVAASTISLEHRERFVDFNVLETEF